MNRWRRRVIGIAALLLAGSVVNMTVAWVIAARADAPTGIHDQRRRDNWKYVTGEAPAGWLAPRAARLGWPRPRRTHTVCATGWRQSMQWCAGGGRHYRFEDFVAGWPLPAVRARLFEETDMETFEVTRGPQWLSGPRIAMGFDLFDESGGRLPLVPVFPGILVNTLFYSSILALPLTFAPLRRWRRRRGGRCGRCGYDLAGIDGPCPECGDGDG